MYFWLLLEMFPCYVRFCDPGSHIKQVLTLPNNLQNKWINWRFKECGVIQGIKLSRCQNSFENRTILDPAHICPSLCAHKMCRVCHRSWNASLSSPKSCRINHSKLWVSVTFPPTRSRPALATGRTSHDYLHLNTFKSSIHARSRCVRGSDALINFYFTRWGWRMFDRLLMGVSLAALLQF